MQKLFTGEGNGASFWGSVSNISFWSNVGAERAERIQQEEKANNPQPERQSSGEQEGPWQAFWGSLGIVTGIRQTKKWLGEVSTSIASLAEKSMNFLGGDGFKSDIAVRGAADIAETTAMWEKASKYMTMSPEMAFDNIVRQGYGFDENGKMVFAGLAGAAALASRGNGNGNPNNDSPSQQPLDVFTLNVSLNASLSQGSYYKEDITNTGWGLIAEVNKKTGGNYHNLQEMQDAVKSGDLSSSVLISAAGNVASQRGGDQAVDLTASLYEKNMGLATGSLTAVGNVIYDQAGNAQGAIWNRGVVESREDDRLWAEARRMEMAEMASADEMNGNFKNRNTVFGWHNTATILLKRHATNFLESQLSGMDLLLRGKYERLPDNMINNMNEGICMAFWAFATLALPSNDEEFEAAFHPFNLVSVGGRGLAANIGNRVGNKVLSKYGVRTGSNLGGKLAEKTMGKYGVRSVNNIHGKISNKIFSKFSGKVDDAARVINKIENVGDLKYVATGDKIDLGYDISKWSEYGLPNDGYFSRMIPAEDALRLKKGYDINLAGQGEGFIGQADELYDITKSIDMKDAMAVKYNPDYLLEFQLKKTDGLQNVLDFGQAEFRRGGKTLNGYSEFNYPGLDSSNIINWRIRRLGK